MGCEPTKTQAAQRKFVQDVALFEKANPGIAVVGDDTNPSDDPTTFDAKPASGTMDNRTQVAGIPVFRRGRMSM